MVYMEWARVERRCSQPILHALMQSLWLVISQVAQRYAWV
jgi:hypothetical protein